MLGVDEESDATYIKVSMGQESAQMDSVSPSFKKNKKPKKPASGPGASVITKSIGKPESKKSKDNFKDQVDGVLNDTSHLEDLDDDGAQAQIQVQDQGAARVES